MRKIMMSGLAVLMICTACDNELDLTAPWKDIPVVYGIISPADTAHYVRIERAFLDPARSALEIARIPDSLYYDTVDAILLNVSNGLRIDLKEIDGTEDGYPREDGLFATTPNILYKVTAAEASLVTGQRYRLEITRSEQLPVITAEATIVSEPTIVRPQPGERIRFPSTGAYRVLWAAAGGAAFYDVILKIKYDEYLIQNPLELEHKTATWKPGGVITTNELEIPGIEFYEFLRGTIEVNSSVRRVFNGIDLQVRAGGTELYEFQRVQLANTGITSAGGDVPQYTNLSEGVGIFSSSNRHSRQDLLLHEDSLDSLRSGSITRLLNFQ